MSASVANGPIAKMGGESVETPDYDESLVEAFERAALTFPSKIALGSDVWEPTYRELNETANRLAHRLIASGVALGDRAAILMSHDTPMVAGVLAILKAGQIVVALNSDDPVSRHKMLVEDAEPSVIVTDRQNWKLAAEFAHPGCRIVTFESETAMEPVENPSIKILPEQTAFLTYTSGTTGRPKGVMKSHRQLRAGAAVRAESMQYAERDRIPLFATLSTGQGTTELWSLLNGVMLCPFSLKTRGVIGLADWIIDRGLTVYASSASIFRTLVKTIDERLVFSNVRAVRLASEAVTADDFLAFRKHFPATSVFVHGLSSSETATIAWSRWTQNDAIPEGVLPVGHFSRDVSLLGDNGQPVARGEVGEIVVKSRYVANGYWRNPELTAERFSADLDGKGTRLVRTGDLGRINAEGLLEFRGRKDDRIKIRGNRIELGEIEQAIERLPGIDRAAIVAVPRENHEPMLVAFAVKTGNASWTAQRLRHAVRANLPLHMVPSRIVFLDSLPYNRGNKIDREALRQYALPIRDDSKSEKSRTETEMLLADIWADVLELPDISRDDNFFNLGGDSLRGAVVAAQVHTALGIELNLGAIADHPTVSTLAAFIDERRRTGVAGTPPIVRVPRAASMPLSLFQESLWSLNGGPEGTHVRSYRVIGPLDVPIFKECLSYLVDRHEILRTTFGLVEGCPAQIIHPSAPLDFSFIDLIDADDPEGQAELIFREKSSREINLENVPIRGNVLIRIATNNYRLISISHLLITDGFASQILDAELATLYEARLQGKEPPLSREPPLQYADYAVWQRQVMQPDSPYFNEAIIWWKNLLSPAPPATKLPFRRLIRRAGLDPSEGVLKWTLEEQSAKRLDEIARSVGATHFIVRLAAFAALVANVTGNSTVVIGTYFANRNRVETQNIVGRFLNSVPFVFSYDASKTFMEWLEIVRDRVFETTTRSELPSEKLKEWLQASGVELPSTPIIFMLSSDHSDQHFGGLAFSDEFWSVGTMPSDCTVYIDERKPENCRVNFDANNYDRNGIRAMLKQYLWLLEAAALEPELPIGTLLTVIGARPLRWKAAEFVRAIYDSSPLLKVLGRPLKRWLFSSTRNVDMGYPQRIGPAGGRSSRSNVGGK
jgi:amino acid adenylation domain-containing protein